MRHVLLVLTTVFLTTSVRADEKPKEKSISEEAAQLKPIPARSPEDSLKEIQMRDGFHAELVVSEPLIHDPVAIDFDEDGRMFVVQLPRYNAYVVDDFKPRGSIALLEDTDGDGDFDRSAIFAEDFNYPTAVACWDGGVFVGDSPNLLYLKDTDGDGKADERRTVLTGFGSDKAGEAHLNSFRWGFNNRFHISTNLSGGNVRVAADESAKPVSVRQRGILLDPRDLSNFELTSGGGQHGMSMDDFGRKFVCSNSVPAQTLVYDDRYVARNPQLAAPNAAVDIAPQGKFTKLYRISPPEPWRELRTRLRRTGKFRGSDEGGKPFGFFTGATGITIYRGDAWPAAFRGNLIVGDVANNLVYRANLEANGVSVTARRADPKAEFLATRDVWTRPVQFANAPDGSLFVLDMYRELIEGAAFLPPEFLDVINVMGGHDRGRIYRLVPKTFRHRATPKLGTASIKELVALIEHPNGWHRDTASRLIYQRQDQAAVSGLRKLAGASKSPVGRMTAMYSLHGLDALDETVLLRGLNDDDPRVRVQAMRLAENVAAELTAVSIVLTSMTDSPELDVRYQLAFSLGSLPKSRVRNHALTRLALSDGNDAWMRLAIQSSLVNGADDVLQNLIHDESFRRSAHGKALLTKLVHQISAADRSFEIATVVSEINALPEADRGLSESLVKALLGSRQGEDRQKLLTAASGRASELVGQLLAEARKTLDDPTDPEKHLAQRVQAVSTLGLGTFDSDVERFRSLFELRQSQQIQVAAIDTLAGFDRPQVAQLLIDAWPSLSPSVRSRAAESLFSRGPWITAFLDAVTEGDISRADVSPSRVALLKVHPDETIRKKVSAVFTSAESGERATVVAAYQPALKLDGNAERGKALFKKNCSACHRLEGVGTAVGADLKAISDRGDASVLLNILDPNREVKPKFVSYVVVTDDGRVTAGMIVAENANSLTLRRPDGMQSTIQRVDIEQLRGTGLSFMPEGLEKEIDPQAMADLLQYLATFR